METPTPHIRIFPHSRDIFRSLDLFTTWLVTSLKARGGKYLLLNADRVAHLPVGSIVLFRHSELIVGEAIVRDYVKQSGIDRVFAAEEQQYGGYVEFVPDSIRLFAPPIQVNQLQRLIGDRLDITVPMGYYILDDWSIYPRLLAAHINSAGVFV